MQMGGERELLPIWLAAATQGGQTGAGTSPLDVNHLNKWDESGGGGGGRGADERLNEPFRKLQLKPQRWIKILMQDLFHMKEGAFPGPSSPSPAPVLAFLPYSGSSSVPVSLPWAPHGVWFHSGLSSACFLPLPPSLFFPGDILLQCLW